MTDQNKYDSDHESSNLEGDESLQSPDTNSILLAMTNLMSDLQNKIDQLDNKIDNKIAQVTTQADSNFIHMSSQVDNKITQVEDNLIQSANRSEHNFAALKQDLKQDMQNKIDQLDNKIIQMTTQVENKSEQNFAVLNNNVQTLQTSVFQIKETMANNEKLLNEDRQDLIIFKQKLSEDVNTLDNKVTVLDKNVAVLQEQTKINNKVIREYQTCTVNNLLDETQARHTLEKTVGEKFQAISQFQKDLTYSLESLKTKQDEVFDKFEDIDNKYQQINDTQQSLIEQHDSLLQTNEEHGQVLGYLKVAFNKVNTALESQNKQIKALEQNILAKGTGFPQQFTQASDIKGLSQADTLIQSQSPPNFSTFSEGRRVLLNQPDNTEDELRRHNTQLSHNTTASFYDRTNVDRGQVGLRVNNEQNSTARYDNHPHENVPVRPNETTILHMESPFNFKMNEKITGRCDLNNILPVQLHSLHVKLSVTQLTDNMKKQILLSTLENVAQNCLYENPYLDQMTYDDCRKTLLKELWTKREVNRLIELMMSISYRQSKFSSYSSFIKHRVEVLKHCYIEDMEEYYALKLSRLCSNEIYVQLNLRQEQSFKELSKIVEIFDRLTPDLKNRNSFPSYEINDGSDHEDRRNNNRQRFQSNENRDRNYQNRPRGNDNRRGGGDQATNTQDRSPRIPYNSQQEQNFPQQDRRFNNQDRDRQPNTQYARAINVGESNQHFSKPKWKKKNWPQNQKKGDQGYDLEVKEHTLESNRFPRKYGQNRRQSFTENNHKRTRRRTSQSSTSSSELSDESQAESKTKKTAYVKACHVPNKQVKEPFSTQKEEQLTQEQADQISSLLHKIGDHNDENHKVKCKMKNGPTLEQKHIQFIIDNYHRMTGKDNT